MTILAIDTSNYTLGIALLREDTVIAEYITYLKKNHSVRAMPAVHSLLNDCDMAPQGLSKIVVAKGYRFIHRSKNRCDVGQNTCLVFRHSNKCCIKS